MKAKSFGELLFDNGLGFQSGAFRQTDLGEESDANAKGERGDYRENRKPGQEQGYMRSSRAVNSLSRHAEGRSKPCRYGLRTRVIARW